MHDVDEPHDNDKLPEITAVEQICEALVDAADRVALGREVSELGQGLSSIGGGLRAIAAALEPPEQRFYARARDADPAVLVPLVVGIGYGVTTDQVLFAGRTWDLVRATSAEEAVFADTIRAFEGPLPVSDHEEDL